jgi:hypothetical protein
MIPGMTVRCWIVVGVLSGAVLAGCGGSGHKATTSTSATTSSSSAATSSSSAANPPSTAALPPGAPPALRSVFGRVLVTNELSGFTPRGRRLLGINATSWVTETETPAPERAAATARLTRLGFVGGVRERLLPDNGAAAEGLSIVEELGTAQSARAELAAQLPLVRAHGPVSTFGVAGIPGAVGFGGSTPQSSGENVAFAKGRYYYLVGAGWTTGTPSPPTRAQLIAAARSLYQRVRP